MSSLIRLVLKMLLCLGLAGVGSSALGTETSAVSDHQLSEPVKTWIGKSGHTWHFRSDSAKRMISFKRVGSKGHEIEFQYDGDSNRPSAARIVGYAWSRKNVSLMDQSDVRDKCIGGNLNQGILPAVFKPSIARALDSKWQTQQISRAQSFKKVDSGVYDDIYYQEALDTYNDIQWMMNDWYLQGWDWWDMAAPSPDKRQQCTDFCNDVTDAAWLACGTLGVLGPGGVVVGLGCAIYFFDRRARCRADCQR